jgi:hypothetical protein
LQRFFWRFGVYVIITTIVVVILVLVAVTIWIRMVKPKSLKLEANAWKLASLKLEMTQPPGKEPPEEKTAPPKPAKRLPRRHAVKELPAAHRPDEAA